MTREEIAAIHKERHLKDALRQVKSVAERLSKVVEMVQSKFPDSEKVIALSTAVETISTALEE